MTRRTLLSNNGNGSMPQEFLALASTTTHHTLLGPDLVLLVFPNSKGPQGYWSDGGHTADDLANRDKASPGDKHPEGEESMFHLSRHCGVIARGSLVRLGRPAGREERGWGEQVHVVEELGKAGQSFGAGATRTSVPNRDQYYAVNVGSSQYRVRSISHEQR
jgi:hypothetical protein